MATIPVVAFDAAGEPLEGLDPTWFVWLNAETGDTATEPNITDRGDGEYGIVDPPEDECGILDFGATAVPRYVLVGSDTFTVIAMFDTSGAPLAGPDPTWAWYRNEAGVDVTPQATFESLGSGLFRIDGLTDGVTGFVDMGVTARPRGLLIGEEMTGGDEQAPVISDLTPVAGTPINRTDSISFKVTDNRGLVGLLIAVKYLKFQGATELVWDGNAAVGPHTVDVEAVTDGYQFTIARTTGWPAAPTICVYAVDASGNEVT